MEVFKILIYVWKKTNDTVDDDYLKVAVIDYATSVIWVSRYRECGEFEIYIPASKELVTLFQGDIIFTRDDSETVMILEKFKLTTDEESGDFLILSGRSLESIFERRVVNKQTNLDGELGAGISHLLEKNCIDPDKSDSDKAIPQLRVNNLSGFTEHLEKQITGDTLLSVFTDICISKDCGFKLTCDDTPNKFIFTLYRGRDMTDTVIFSPQFGNLSKSEFTFDYSNYFNYIYTAGEGEGKDRVVIGYESDDAVNTGLTSATVHQTAITRRVTPTILWFFKTKAKRNVRSCGLWFNTREKSWTTVCTNIILTTSLAILS